MSSFQANKGWKRPRKRENKNYRSDHFLPDRNREFQKNCKKLKSTIIASFQAKVGWKTM